MYLIEILHQTTTTPVASGDFSSCILSKFYIKPQHFDFEKRINYVVSYRNSTSNHNYTGEASKAYLVVSYRNSTSNHNSAIANVSAAAVVSYRNSTSNHNIEKYNGITIELYLIEILHQTTTWLLSRWHPEGCILSKFYIKPQLMEVSSFPSARCILSKFYIKPQQGSSPGTARAVVSYRNSTSNHNVAAHSLICLMLYLIEILHQTTTCIRWGSILLSCILSKFYIKPQLGWFSDRPWRRCILSKFYIKPQLRLERELAHCVVSYRNSTSNHNSALSANLPIALYLIEILHQTTTHRDTSVLALLLYLIEILHQTTTPFQPCRQAPCCILSKFYIKPQLQSRSTCANMVVSYRNSTSNHNNALCIEMKTTVVSYRNSTSNHNSTCSILEAKNVVSYRNSTSNHNTWLFGNKDSLLYLIEILHQTTTAHSP